MTRRSWFGRRADRSDGDARAALQRIPSDLVVKCPNPSCGQILIQKDLEREFKVCRKCGYHFLLTTAERLALLLDPDSFEPFELNVRTGNPLDFPGYPDKLMRHRERTGLDEAVTAGRGVIGGLPLAISITDNGFMAGSMNSVVGEAVAQTLERAADLHVPALLISGTGGGARMEEGLLSLMQMAKTAAAFERFDSAGLLSICLLTDSTMAGVFASWASLGDVILAEPGAMVGFTGERVAAKVQTERPPDNFRTAEFNYEHGMIDQVVHRSQLRETIQRLLELNERSARETHTRAAVRSRTTS